jgi:hypothetical protein
MMICFNGTVMISDRESVIGNGNQYEVTDYHYQLLITFLLITSSLTQIKLPSTLHRFPKASSS